MWGGGEGSPSDHTKITTHHIDPVKASAVINTLEIMKLYEAKQGTYQMVAVVKRAYRGKDDRIKQTCEDNKSLCARNKAAIKHNEHGFQKTRGASDNSRMTLRRRNNEFRISN